MWRSIALTLIGFFSVGCGSDASSRFPSGEGGSPTGGASASRDAGASTGGGAMSGGAGGSTGGRAMSGGAGASTGGRVTSGGTTGSTGGRATSGGTTGSTGGRATSAGGTAAGGAASGGAAGSTNGAPPYADVKAKIDAYKAAHPGNGGKDWDINAKSPAEIAADPAAAELLALCGKDQRPVIPLLAWEYGGGDHQWINPNASALVYCVYIPVNPATDHFSYDAGADHVTADVYVLYPEQNPCRDRMGADQVLGCLGDSTNIEILVDTASLNDGMDVGLSLSNASTELRLVEPDGTRIHLADVG